MTDQELAICVPCQSTGGSLPAVKFCTTCGESLCKSCVEFHSKLKITQAHVLVDCSSNNTDIIQAAQVLSTYMVCQNHGDKTVEFLCEEHDKVCCPTCATLNHRMCQHVVEIKKLANRPKIKRNIDRFRAHLEEAGSCMEEIINVNNVCRMDFEKSKKNIPNQLEQMKLTVVKLFERIESDVMDKINSMYVDEDIVTCNREERWIMKLNANADLVKMLDTIIEIGTDHQVFVALHKMKSTLLDTKMACADQGPHIVGKRLTLKIKDILEHVLQTEIIDDLVAVETVMNQFDLPKTHAYNSSVDVEEATTSSDTLEEECDEACSTRKTNEDTLVGMYISKYPANTVIKQFLDKVL